MFHYHFCFNRNKQIVTSIIINKFFTSIETICTNCIFSVLIISTSTSSALFTYLNQKFSSVASKSESWTDTWYDLQMNLKKFTIEEKFQLQKQNYCWSCRKSDYWDSDKICFFHNYKQLNIMTASIHKFFNSEESEMRKA